MTEKVGFIGLGNMGSGMANNLAAAGVDVLAFDIDETKSAELSMSGAQIASSTKEIATGCKIVVLCLPHPDATQQVIFDELLIRGNTVATIIETSTLTPEIVTDIADKLANENVRFLSAPMIGGKNAAHDKTIQFLVEGPEETYKQYKEILEAMGSRVDYMGNPPSATLAKLVFNLCRYANLAVAVEAYRLLQPYSPNMESVYDFMREQSLDNFGQVWGEDMKDMMTKNIPFQPSQVPKKDLALLMDMAAGHHLNNEMIEAIRNTYISME